MVFATLFPLGILQLNESVHHGYFEARSLKFLGNPANAVIEWMRFPGDAVFIIGGILPFALSDMAWHPAHRFGHDARRT
jgi:nitric oxide reductase subunit B